ncbi:MAG TPA: hypothetical protein VH702_04695 [Vicinamibacterales bacterium]|jgi:hypothetical protein
MRASFVVVVVLIGVVASASLVSVQRDFVPPRTPWGDPDLQGMWPTGALVGVPFERAPELGTRDTLSDAEIAKFYGEFRTQLSSSNVNPPEHWLELTIPTRQASLIVDPANGRLPAMTPDGQRRARTWPVPSTSYFTGPEDFNPYDRCITRGVLGSAFPNAYSSGMQILQAPGVITVFHEMIHEARVIPVDGRPHVNERIRSYMGDPKGRWERDTLVVETTNFNGRTGSYARNGNGNPTSTSLRLVERFTLVAADTLRYEVVVNDTGTWTRPWTVAFSIQRDPGYAMYEYACHEGNYALPNMLSASRAADAVR